jgi:putative oxidoreductase
MEENVLQKLTNTQNDPMLAFARLALGIVYFAHGAQKLLGWFGGAGFSGTMSGFTHMGMPAPLAFLVIFIEFFGGLSLLLGLLSRLAGLGIAAEMIGAVLMVHLRFGFFMNWMGQKKGEGFEYHLLAIALAVLVLVRGAGAFSIDRLIAGRE